MERFHCKDLFDFISEQGPLPETLAKDLFKQILQTIMDCHKRGIVHRDIKDENILIDIKTFRTKVIDFGSGAYIEDKVYHRFQGTRVSSPPEWINSRAEVAAHPWLCITSPPKPSRQPLPSKKMLFSNKSVCHCSSSSSL